MIYSQDVNRSISKELVCNYILNVLCHNSFESSNLLSTLDQCKSRLTDLDEKIEVKSTEKAEFDDRKEQLRTALNNSKV